MKELSKIEEDLLSDLLFVRRRGNLRRKTRRDLGDIQCEASLFSPVFAGGIMRAEVLGCIFNSGHYGPHLSYLGHEWKPFKYNADLDEIKPDCSNLEPYE